MNEQCGLEAQVRALGIPVVFQHDLALLLDAFFCARLEHGREWMLPETRPVRDDRPSVVWLRQLLAETLENGPFEAALERLVEIGPARPSGRVGAPYARLHLPAYPQAAHPARALEFRGRKWGDGDRWARHVKPGKTQLAVERREERISRRRAMMLLIRFETASDCDPADRSQCAHRNS